MRSKSLSISNNTGSFLTLLFFAICIDISAQSSHPENDRSLIFPRHQLLRDTAAIQLELKDARSLQDDHLDSAVRKIRLAFESSLALKYNKGALKSLTELGVLYHIHNQNNKAITALQLALSYRDTGKAGYATATSIYTAIAYRYMFIGRDDSAGLYYYKALDEIESGKVDNPDILINTYSQLIVFWLNLNENPEQKKPEDKYIETAIAYLNKAEQLPHNNNRSLGKIILSKGHVHYLLHQFDSARYHYHRFITLAQQDDMKTQSSFVTSTYMNMASTFIFQKLPDSAVFYSKKVLERFELDGRIDTNLLISGGYSLGEAYLMQHKYNDAIQALTPALAVAKTQSLSEQYMGHDLLAKAYVGAGNYQAAWEQQKAYSDIRDSLIVESNVQAISQMEMKYKVSERNKELVQKELVISSRDNKIKTQRLWITGMLSAGLLIALTAVLLYRQNMHKQKIAVLQGQQEKEMAMLQAMIEGEEKERTRLANELHDGIGGLLGTIRMQLGAALKTHRVSTQDGEFKDILLLLEGAYDELRKTAHNLMPEVLQQEGLEIATGIFCDRVRKTDALEVNYETVGDIPRFRPSLELALYRIIQELMHNILKHAKATEALVQLAFIGNCLSVTVEDNGVGIQTPVRNEKKGMGIKTIQERIRKMGGKFDIASSVGAGTSINMELPLTGNDMIYLKT